MKIDSYENVLNWLECVCILISINKDNKDFWNEDKYMRNGCFLNDLDMAVEILLEKGKE